MERVIEVKSGDEIEGSRKGVASAPEWQAGRQLAQPTCIWVTTAVRSGTRRAGRSTAKTDVFRRTTLATPTTTLPQLLTIDQLAEQLNVSVRHVRRLVAEKRVPYLKVGKFVRFDSAEISSWLDRSRVAG
jgi:excisionase family DNA binding protein